MISQLLTILSKRRYLLPCVRLKRPGHVHSYAEPRGTDQRPSIDQEHGKGPCPTTSAAGHVEAVRWKDIELYFVTLPGQRTTIAARVTIRLLKGKRNDDSKSKANVLRLLPEDPLLCPIFDLLTLADQGGVSTMSAEDTFDEVLRPSRDPVGSRQPIPLDATKGEQFVLRDYEGGANGATASTRAADVKWLDERCLSVGLPAGFIGRHTIYVWRRMGFEAINDPSVTVADRDHQMGHDPNSDVYQAYLSRTSLIDVQGPSASASRRTRSWPWFRTRHTSMSPRSFPPPKFKRSGLSLTSLSSPVSLRSPKPVSPKSTPEHRSKLESEAVSQQPRTPRSCRRYDSRACGPRVHTSFVNRRPAEAAFPQRQGRRRVRSMSITRFSGERAEQSIFRNYDHDLNSASTSTYALAVKWPIRKDDEAGLPAEFHDPFTTYVWRPR